MHEIEQKGSIFFTLGAETPGCQAQAFAARIGVDCQCIRYLDKLVDELAKGIAMEKIGRA